nr:MAG TPA: hypothetical protein [Caudoviricetes sp.]
MLAKDIIARLFVFVKHFFKKNFPEIVLDKQNGK